MDLRPSLPEGTILRTGSWLRFVCALLKHVRVATGAHGRFDDYDLCGRCGRRQTWGDAIDTWRAIH